MSVFQKLKAAFLQTDMFCSSEILRYKSETQYKTLSGAVVSTALIIAIVVGFSDMIMSMMQRTSIESTLQTNKSLSPKNLKLSQAENNFMFGTYIKSLDSTKIFDLFNGPQVFDFKSFSIQIKNGVIKNKVPLTLQPCTREHWKKLPHLVENFDSLQMSKWLCAPLGSQIQLQGFYSQKEFKSHGTEILICVNSSYNGNKCASQQVIDETFANYTNFYLMTGFINPFINQNEPEAVKYYLEERNVVIFSKSRGAKIRIEFSEYEINTDTSILPFENIQTQKGYILEEVADAGYYESSKNLGLVSTYFSKSPNELTYTRNVLKILTIFSYIGGLIGALTSFFFIVKNYTDISLEMNLSADLFYEKKISNEEITVERSKFNFNFLKFLYFYAYRLLQLINKGQSFEIPKKMEKYQKQMSKQLDIKVLLQRIIKLEACITFLFDEEDIQGIRNLQEITIERAQQLRTMLHKSDSAENNNEQEGEKQEEPRGPIDEGMNREANADKKQRKREKAANELNLRDQIPSEGQRGQFSGMGMRKDLQSQVNGQIVQVQQMNEDFIPVEFIGGNNEQISNNDDSQSQYRQKGKKSSIRLQKLKKIAKKSQTNDVKKKIWQQLNINVKKSIHEIMVSELQLKNMDKQEKDYSKRKET